MQTGTLISSTNGVYYCGNIHVTKRDLNNLRHLQLVKRKQFVGKYSVELELTDKAKELKIA